MTNPDLQMNPKMEQINGEIRDNFRALANGFQKLDKIEDSTRQSKQLEDLTGKMIECKRLIKEFDHEIKVEESRSSPEVSKKLKDEKQSMIKALNSYMSFVKIYQNILGNKRVELFIMEAGNIEPMAEDNARVASEMLNQELNLAGNNTMGETDQAIERSKKVVYQPVVLGTQTAATLKGQTDQMGLVNEPDTIQVSIKKESQLFKETGPHVSTHNLPINSPSSSSSGSPQFIQQQHLFQQFQQFQQQMQQPPSQQMQPPPPEPSLQRRGKKPASRTPWTPDDETRLAQCWVQVSEEKKVENSPTQESFWYRVMDEYNAGTSVQRRKDQLSSKWRDLNQHVTKFNDIFVKLTNERANGDSDLNVMELALETYLRDGGHAFTHLHAWNLLKDKRKWLNPDPVVIGRRNKKRPAEEDSLTNLDDHELFVDDAIACPPDMPKKPKRQMDEEEDSPINLDDNERFGDDAIACPPNEPKKPKRLTDEEDLPINVDDHERFGDDAIPSPLDKPIKPKSQRSSSTGVRLSEGSSHDSVVFTDRVFEKLSAILQKNADFFDRKIEIEEQKIRLEQLKFLAFRTDGMLEQDRILVEKEKAAIRNKYNL